MTIPGKFSSFLIDVNYKTEIECFKNNYVVLDIETNGLRTATDDLLSISIYDPTTGICYNRFLPLDLQPVVLTGWINGITEEMLETATHISQEEFDQIIDYFKLNEKIILSYSGGQGSFDSSFLEQYCKRHNLIGYEKFKYENIKSILPFPGFGYEGLLSKDNLCRLFNIIIDNKIHSSMNDCLLEWQLFEKIKNQPLFFANQYLMRFNKGYIVPVSYLNRFPELAKYANITIPHIESKTELIFSHVLPRNILKLVKKFPTNITGIALEHGLYSKLQVEKQDNSLFLLKNKQYLENLGTLENRLSQIPVVIKTDGSIQSLDKKSEEFIKEINYVTKLITENMQPVFNYIKNEIFHNEKILSQELSISNDNKVLAICDLSSKTKIMEIKTFNAIQNGKLLKKVATQLFYESKGRRKFLLTIDFKEKNERLKKVLSKVCINIYEVEQVISDPIPEIFTYQLSIYDLMILKLIKNNPCITNIEIAHRISISSQGVSTILKRLKEFGYISNIDEFGKKRHGVF